jgi:hypothetical protein
MTSIIQVKIKYRRQILTVMLCALVDASAKSMIVQKKDKSMIGNQMNQSLWQAVATLAKHIPFSKEKVEEVLPIRLNESRRSEHTVFLEGGDVNFNVSVTAPTYGRESMKTPE